MQQSSQPERETAEWIVEDTQVNGSFPALANFGSVTFSATSAYLMV